MKYYSLPEEGGLEMKDFSLFNKAFKFNWGVGGGGGIWGVKRNFISLRDHAISSIYLPEI